MPIEWGVPIAAGINSAAGLLGGFMNRGLSQRDAMAAQSDFARKDFRWQNWYGPKFEQKGLKLAGINPMLRYGKGGSMTPASFNRPGIAQPINPGMYLAQSVGQGISSAIDAVRTGAQVEQMGEQARKLSAETDRIAYEINKIQADTTLSVAQRELAVANKHKAFADEVLSFARSSLTKDQSEQLQAHTKVLKTQAGINAFIKAREEAVAALRQADIPLAQADAAFYDTWFGQFIRYLDNIVNPVQGLIPGGTPSSGRAVGPLY